MGIVNNDKVSFGSSYDYDDAVREIGGLLGVGPREDGMYYLADICTADSVNDWALHRPLGSSANANLSDSDRKNINYGYAVYADAWNGDLATSQSWTVYKPGNSSVKRIKDFNNYNHKATPPLDFVFPDGTKTAICDTTFSNTFPYIDVLYRWSSSIVSSSVSSSCEVPMENIVSKGNILNPSSTEFNLNNYRPCVIAKTYNGEYRIANGKHTLGNTTASNINNLKIDLSKFNIQDAERSETLSAVERELLPSSATNIKTITLYPRLNDWSGTTSSILYSKDSSNPFGDVSWDFSQIMGNGWAGKGTHQFLYVPNGEPLKIIKFNSRPYKVNFNYLTIQEDGTNVTPGNWLFVEPSNPYAKLDFGGSTIHFGSKTVTFILSLGITSADNNTSEIYLKPYRFTFSGGFSTTNVTWQYPPISTGAGSGIIATFNPGSYSDYIFSSSGSLPVTVEFAVGKTSDTFGIPFEPEQEIQKLLYYN